jgi:hypothetical protein
MHVIRLRGPWELVTDAVASDEPRRARESQRVTVPCDPAEILGTHFTGQVQLIRPFNTPTNLESHERVYLALEGLPPAATLALNGALLPCPVGRNPARCDITAELALHNRLEVTLELPGGSLGEVRLEIG